MATGDQSNMLTRLMRQMPPWFSSASTVINAVLAGAAGALTTIYGLWAYLVAQTRLATCSGGFLDMFAQDYFGATLVRRQGQSDAALRARISALLFAEKNTRNGMIKALTILTGHAPVIREAMIPSDTGGYRVAGFGYRAAGAYGSMRMGAQCLITVYRPTGIISRNLPGYRTGPAGYRAAGSAYGTMSGRATGITDQDILDTINAVKPAGVICWVNIANAG